MKRRQFISLLGGAAASPLVPQMAARAEAAIPVLGFLHSLAPEFVPERLKTVREALRRRDFSEGANLVIEYAWGGGQYEKLPQLAAGLAGKKVAAILAGSTPAALAAQKATATIPIVFAGVGADPVAVGLVASLNRPGGNVTGVALLSTSLVAKRLEVLCEMVPAALHIGFLVNSSNPNFPTTLREVEGAALKLRRELVTAGARDPLEFEQAFASLARQRPGALLVDTDPMFLGARKQLVALAARYRLPAIYEFRDFVADGGLLAYGPDPDESYRIATDYVGRILRGEKVSDLPVQQSTRVELVINQTTAKALGLTIPISLLGRADEVIE